MRLRGERDQGRERRVGELRARARTAREAGRLPDAMAFLREAIELSRELAAEFPGDPRHRQSIASAQYTLGDLLTDNDEAAASVPVLEESERLYTSLGEDGFLDARPLVADVLSRRAYALARVGRGASAVAESDAAVSAYADLAVTGDHDFDLARVLAVNAVILSRFGDPDVAVGAADQAIRIWVSRRVSPTQFMIGDREVRYLLWASTVASTVHAAYGRPAVSLFASELGLQFIAATSALPIVGEWVTEVRAAAAAYGRFGADHGAALDYATKLRVMVRAVGRPADLGPTLAEVLWDAGEDELIGAITRPAMDCVIATPSQRCAVDAPKYAQRLAAVAMRLLPGEPAGGTSAGLEAHWLYAAALRRDDLQMRQDFPAYGRPWAEVLLATSEAQETLGDPVLALDLASWAGDVAQRLLPHLPDTPDLTDLAVRCFQRHGHLLVAAGDREEGAAALAQAERLTGTGGG